MNIYYYISKIKPHCILLPLLLFISLAFTLAVNNKQYSFGHIDYRDGLSNNRVLCFSEDNNGFMWIGTIAGLNRYDGYEFKSFNHSPYDSNSIPDNTVQSITKDQLGRFWITTPKGMAVFNPELHTSDNTPTLSTKEKTIDLTNSKLVIPYKDSLLIFLLPETGLVSSNIFTNDNTFIDLNKGDIFSPTSAISHMAISGEVLYTLHKSGEINILNLETHKTVKSIYSIKEFLGTTEHEYQLFIDDKNKIWIYSIDEDFGIICIDENENIELINTNTKPALNSNIVSSIIQDDYDQYWIGTDHGGLNILDYSQQNIEYIKHDKNSSNSISQDVITTLYRSKDGTIWIGTFKQGINYYHENLFQFYHYKNQTNNKSSLPYNDVNCFVEDDLGNLWIGTNGEGLIYFDRTKNIFTSISTRSSASGGPESDVIVSLLIDKEGLLWIGTYHGGLLVYDGKKFKRYLNAPSNPNSISDNKIWELYEDSKGNLWVGTLGGGLDLFNRKNKTFTHFSGKGLKSISSNFIIDIIEDQSGNLWFGTDEGVFVYLYNDSRFINITHDNENVNSLSDNFVSKIFIDSRENVWIGTRNGLNLYNDNNKTVKRININNKSLNNSIMGILESDLGNIWVSTSGGLYKLVITYNKDGSYNSHHSVFFDENDGLQGREFNEGSVLKTTKGELIFGGSNGFNICFPKNENQQHKVYKTKIIGLEIFGEEIDILNNRGKKDIINSTVLNNKTIKIPYKENIFSLKFVTTNYLSAKKINYRYKLEGFNQQWIYSSWQERKATYTNLNPGKYVFKVQSTDFISEWSESEAAATIIILPPWYRTWAAYISFSLILLFIIVFARRIIIQTERVKFNQEQADKESKRQQELNALKTRFFTNVSHEFRTPLTLILTPLNKLIKNTTDENTIKHLSLINQNAKRLLVLVNQLLDFRKVEENKIQVNYIYGNIIGFIEHIIESFADLQESKNVDLDFLPDEKELFIQFDKDKIEKIIMNLISNAFKFTPEKGYIRIFTEVVTVDGFEQLKIRVKDSGIGISQEQKERIFERFYQSSLPNEFITRGSGIGLSLTQDFVQLLNGSIKVDSEINKGSTFTILLPLNREIPQNSSEEITWEKEQMDAPVTNNEIEPEKTSNTKKTIMLVEDNADFRYYLNDSLKSRFNIIECENGKQALDTLKNVHPDLIVSDVMMPVMDGLELCHTIKTDHSFSHIPIILLTAKSTQQDELEGLQQGADDYVTKPFNLDILEARIDYLLATRKEFITHYQKTFKVESDIKSITPLDEKLLNKIHELINENLSNSEYSVEKLSKEIGMSRVYLYKKSTSLTGKTPIELIRLIRLKKAADLLIQGQLNISEITYEVGFNDPKYFSKQFKATYGELPSKYRNTQSEE